MHLSLNWLEDYVKIPRGVSPEELAEKLTQHTVEVEKIEKQAQKFAGVIVGKILEINKHPNADRLQIARVDIGSEELIIVCGAPNIAVDQLVPVATVGAILPNGLAIKAADVRGQKSVGMLCAEDELGLGSSHEGILILDKAKVGQKFADYLKLDDIILEIDNKSLSNRADLFGYYGLAREVSAFLETDLKDLGISEIKLEANDKKADLEKLKVSVKDGKACPRYMALKISDIEVKDSNPKIQNRLIASGMRPINNIVDITNYVMLALGQPLHAFDGDLIKEIIVRPAKPGEKILCLDGEDRILNENNLVIADAKEPLAIAGIIGGEKSSISNTTKSLIIESANFDGFNIRQTSTKLGVRTESSTRFEKSLDPNLAEDGMKLAVKMILASCPKAQITSHLIDIKNFDEKAKTIKLSLTWLDNLLGMNIPKPKVLTILENLGFKVIKDEADELNIEIPSWRSVKDITIPEDIAEEIARINGYNNIPSLIPNTAMIAPILDSELIVERKIKDILAGANALTEVMNYSFVNEEDLKKANIISSNYLSLANPVSQQQTLLRQNLIIGLLNNVKLNQYQFDNIGLFEVGQVFFNIPGEFKKEAKGNERLPHQEKHVAIVLADKQADLLGRLKGKVENLIKILIGENTKIEFRPTEFNLGFASSVTAATIFINKQSAGIVALVDKSVNRNLGIKTNTAVAELDIPVLVKLLGASSNNYTEVPKYPPVVRDLAFVVDQKIMYNDLKTAIETFDPLISNVELFDVYSGKSLGDNKKNLAFHIIYRDLDKTLTAEEVDAVQAKLLETLETKFEAQIRNF